MTGQADWSSFTTLVKAGIAGGPMSAMKANVESLIKRFHKDVILAEDQYPQEPQQSYGIYVSAYATIRTRRPATRSTPQGKPPTSATCSR